MPRESLQVTPSHLHALAGKHGQAAAAMMSATDAVVGVDSGIRTSHGVIASSTAFAVGLIQQARRGAGSSVAARSHALRDALTAAAGRYEASDRASGGCLDQQIRAQ